MSDCSEQLPQKRKAIDDGDDVLNHNQDMDIAFSSNRERQGYSQESELTFESNTVHSMLSDSVGNLNKSTDGTLGDTENIPTATATSAYHLIKPRGKIATFWTLYKLYDPTHHPDLQNFAHCILCHASISTKGRTTTGLTKHLQYKHREEYEKMNERSVVSMRKDTEGTPSVASIFQKKGKDKSVADIKMEYLHAVTNFIIAESHAFTSAASFEFRSLFRPFHKDADKITNVTPHKIREQVFSLGALAKRATKLEAGQQRGSWTTDHWTGCDDATYTTTTFHYIKNWEMRSIIVDFKVFHGTTSGEAIYNDQAKVLAGYTTKCNLVIGITDTTGSMGVLGKHLRDNGMEHAYCTDHNLHCNAVLAFNGEHQSSCM